MNPRVLAALLLTLLGFAAGFAARLWTERAPAMPPPPHLGGEFTPKGGPPEARRPVNRAELIAEIERVRPQIEAYQARLAELDAEFDQGFLALLNPGQREQFETAHKKRAEKAARDEAKAAADPTPLSDDQIDRLQRRPLYGVLRMITITPRVESQAAEYKLDPAQQAKLHDLLAARREKFIALLDQTPPPSLRYSALAPVVQKITEPKK